MSVAVATPEDVNWIVDVLSRRRGRLVEQAPIFWRPAPDAEANHRAFLNYLLTDGGAKAYRTADAVLIAASHGDGWLIDDADVAGGHWASRAGRDLWNALAADCPGAPVRFVCPTYEPDRSGFAQAAGLVCAESWWLMELPGSGEGEVGVQVVLPGADAVTVGAPPVYAPPGQILYLPAPTDVALSLSAVIATARDLGCAAIVINDNKTNDDLALSLTATGLRRHCDFFEGTVQEF